MAHAGVCKTSLWSRDIAHCWVSKLSTTKIVGSWPLKDTFYHVGFGGVSRGVREK
jgi:hypothetical protein